MNSKSIIVGTAGHIDHGKTALVRALTGVDADRLPEEKRRGITIDIGFADLDLGAVHVGFVDVPGHERFVKNMLAGAHGIDVVALVIAADESVMPQTREHFDICRLLGVSRGLIVLTKSDLVDEELLQLAQAEAEELVKGSFLEGAPIVAVSSRTGQGVGDVREVLKAIGSDLPERAMDSIGRLPIDRSFTMRGFGAVVTGTLVAGAIAEGEELELLPAVAPVRVRGLQVHNTSVKQAVAGQRTAVNLGGIESTSITRGMMLAPPRRLRPTQIVDAAVQILNDAPRGLRSRQRVRVHLGAAEALARVRVLDEAGEIRPGAKGFAQLRFETPLVAVLGDRFIVRAYSPQITIGGGEILDAFATKHRTRDLTAVRAGLENLRSGDRLEQLRQFVISAGRTGLTESDLVARTAWSDELIAKLCAEAAADGSVTRAESTLLAAELFQELKRQAVDQIAAHHEREPLSRGLSKEILRDQSLASAPEVFRAVISELESEGAVVGDKEVVRLRAHTRELSDADAGLRNALENLYRAAALAPPSLSEAFAGAGLNRDAQHARKILQLLLDSGVLLRVHGDMIFHQAALLDLEERLRAYAGSQPNRVIDVPGFKELTGVSRKYAIPLLEYFDRRRVTRREGDKRVIL